MFCVFRGAPRPVDPAADNASAGSLCNWNDVSFIATARRTIVAVCCKIVAPLVRVVIPPPRAHVPPQHGAKPDRGILFFSIVLQKVFVFDFDSSASAP